MRRESTSPNTTVAFALSFISSSPVPTYVPAAADDDGSAAARAGINNGSTDDVFAHDAAFDPARSTRSRFSNHCWISAWNGYEMHNSRCSVSKKKTYFSQLI